MRSRVAARGSRYYTFGRDGAGRYRFTPASLPRSAALIGRGEVGGKARGLLYVMHHVETGAQLTEHSRLIRFPDSLIVTTEVFDAFMEQNRLADAVRAGCRGTITLERLNELIRAGTFPLEWAERLVPFLEKEPRPLVVRSSSVMEDDPEHSFAGIYLSVFLTNRGSREQRLGQLIDAIKQVFASTFAPNARAYRKRHSLDWQEEKMAVLIQNMIGSEYSHSLFYPLVGGVAFSRNYYPWTDRLTLEDGVVRLVVGTGTRAVGREYARVFSPKLPSLRPEGSDVRAIIRHSQETVDVLDLVVGGLCQRKLTELDNPLLNRICSIAGADGALREPLATAATLAREERFLASFSRLIEGDTLMPFTPLIRQTLDSLERLLELPVDIEFAVDFSSPEVSQQRSPLFFILQARPLGNRPEHRRIRFPTVTEESTVLACHRVLGNGLHRRIRHLVLVEPASYRWEKAYDIARSIGRINDWLCQREEPYILMGPGRWASTNPQLGVPVQYNELSGATVIVEMSTASFSPELSYGTHFYAEMVATGILYLPFHEEEGDRLNRRLLSGQRIAYQDRFVTHYTIPSGLDVYVDGANQRGIVALSS